MRNFRIIIRAVVLIPIFVIKIIAYKNNEDMLSKTGLDLRLFFEQLGGIYLKFGQILSLRIDLLPISVCNQLRNLLDKVPTFSLDETKAIFFNDFGKDLNKVFKDFPNTPIASASIGQVYKAKLTSGESVAVKVLRPSIEKTVNNDLKLILGIAKFFNIVTFGTFRIYDIAKEFKAWITEEIDYRNEANNLKEFSEHSPTSLPLFDLPLKINTPKIYLEYSSKNILTMEYIEGITVNKLIEIRKNPDQTEFNNLVKQGLDLPEVVKKMIRYLIKQLYIDGYFNADPHPANIIVTPENEIYYIDFGLVGRLTQKQRLAVFRFLRSMTVFDYETATQAAIIMFNVIDIKKQTKLRSVLKNVVKKLKSLSEEDHSLYTKFSQQSTLELLKTIYKMRLPIPVEVSRSLRAAVTSDGLMQSLYPEGDFKEMTNDMYKASIALTYLNIKSNLTQDNLKKWILKFINFIETETLYD